MASNAKHHFDIYSAIIVFFGSALIGCIAV
jgi:hypothetical protein